MYVLFGAVFVAIGALLLWKAVSRRRSALAIIGLPLVILGCLALAFPFITFTRG